MDKPRYCAFCCSPIPADKEGCFCSDYCETLCVAWDGSDIIRDEAIHDFEEEE